MKSQPQNAQELHDEELLNRGPIGKLPRGALKKPSLAQAETENESSSDLKRRYLGPRKLQERLDRTLVSSQSPKPTPKK